MPDFSALPFSAMIAVAALVGLIVGSFLNVVILRLPARLKFIWHQECVELVAANSPLPEAPGIVKPASHCPHCKTPIKPWHNIPLLGFLLLGGKCRHCQVSISWRYPLVELLCGILTAYAVYHFGLSYQALFASLLIWGLIALTFIDLDTQLLPDIITLPLLWLGLLANTQSLFASPVDAIYGASGAYLALWSISHLFRLATKKEGMGYGDFKLLSLFGAWFGWQLLTQIVIISSVTGIIGATMLILFKQNEKNSAIPFGPYLSLAGLIALFWGDDINHWYFDLATLP